METKKNKSNIEVTTLSPVSPEEKKVGYRLLLCRQVL